MPGMLANLRVRAILENKASRYLAYAVGEVILIFIGITLAIAFDNGVEQRRQDELAFGLLLSIKENLQTNIGELERNIGFDEQVLESAVKVTDYISSDNDSWNDSLGPDLGRSLFWSSPFFADSGYESLKQVGLFAITNETLRNEITNLFEVTYAYLVGDLDRTMWAFQESVLYPVQVRELIRITDGTSPSYNFEPRDYIASREKGELLAMLLEHQVSLNDGLQLRKAALRETQVLVSKIEDALLDKN